MDIKFQYLPWLISLFIKKDINMSFNKNTFVFGKVMYQLSSITSIGKNTTKDKFPKWMKYFICIALISVLIGLNTLFLICLLPLIFLIAFYFKNRETYHLTVKMDNADSFCIRTKDKHMYSEICNLFQRSINGERFDMNDSFRTMKMDDKMIIK